MKALLPLLVGCTTIVEAPGESTPLCGDDVDASVDATPTPDAPAAPGCNPTPNAVFTDTTGQGHVTMTLKFPANYASSCATARPLVMVLDGFGGDGPTAINRFQLAGYENEASGALVIAPTGIVSSSTHFTRWNASPACCEPIQPANDDVVYLGGLLDRVVAAGWNVDRSRVYVLGMSNGAMMANRLACERADIVTGTFEISTIGLPVGMTCKPSQPVHRALHHAWPDSTIRYAVSQQDPIPVSTGGSLLMPSAYPTVEGPGGTVDQAAKANGCAGTLDVHPASYSYGPRTLNFDDHPGYPTGVADTVVVPIAGCPATGSVTFYQCPYLAPTCNHSLSTGADFGVAVRDWMRSHHR